MKPALRVQGMHGLGDCLHQLAVVRQLTEKHTVFLETSWPQIYHDLKDVKCIYKPTVLRTQKKNATTSCSAFYNGNVPDCDTVKVTYDGSKGSVLKSMMENLGLDYERAYFDLLIPSNWYGKVPVFDTKNKPILIYRPLVERKEFPSGNSRNPLPKHYYDLFQSIRDDYYVISIADVDDENEWIVSEPIDADISFHAGELSFETLAALFSIADMVYCAPGFATILAKAVETPVITVFGNYEDSSSFVVNNQPYGCMIDTIARCRCFKTKCGCNKEIDMVKAIKQIQLYSNKT